MANYSTTTESCRILDFLIESIDDVSLPPQVASERSNVRFSSVRNKPYFPIPFKESETTAALKALEGCVAAALANTCDRPHRNRGIHISLEKTTAFLFQAYLAKIGGLGKLDKTVRRLLKGLLMPGMWFPVS